MTFLVHAVTDPVTSITGPLYHLARGDKSREGQIQQLMLAIFRTATVAAFFFMIIPFNYIFGHHDNLSGSFVFTVQFLIHPYAAALFNAFVNGGHLVMTKVMDIVVKRQLILTRDDLGGCVRAIGFCYIAQLLKSQAVFTMQGLDAKYMLWSQRIARWACPEENSY